MAQQAVEQVGVEKHSYTRTGRMALYGGGMSQNSLPAVASKQTHR